MAIVLENVSHVYMKGSEQEVYALADISLTIEDGSFTCIIGQTGSGKSTLVQHFNALMLPSSGRVTVNGLDVAEKKLRRDVRRQVGMVFQYPEYQLFDETVAKDVAFGPRNLGIPPEEIDECVRRAMEESGLAYDEYAEKSPFELSGGEKRRAALAGIIATRPSILVLDEPMAGLDPVGRREILRFLKNYHQQGHTVIMVSHSMDDVAELASQVIVMHEGKVTMSGTPHQVFMEGERLQALRLGRPHASLMAEKLRQRGLAIPLEVCRMDELLTALEGEVRDAQ